jgi:hypothetical protein
MKMGDFADILDARFALAIATVDGNQEKVYAITMRLMELDAPPDPGVQRFIEDALRFRRKKDADPSESWKNPAS